MFVIVKLLWNYGKEEKEKGMIEHQQYITSVKVEDIRMCIESC
jgi:hypothetical protein